MIEALKDKMSKAVDRLKSHFTTIRTGRANPDVLAKIQVEYYGSMVPLKQVANVTVPESMTLMLTLFDKGAVKAVEKAILSSDLGLNPAVDGTTIRLRFPDLTEDRRKELVKVIKKQAEEAKIALRNLRRDFLEDLKKNKDVPEDQAKKLQDDVQKQTDHFTKLIDQSTAEKEAEVMKI
jgi:ribosome recycling factor